MLNKKIESPIISRVFGASQTFSPTKHRNRNPLTPNCHELRYSAESQTKKTLLKVKVLSYDYDTIEPRRKRGLNFAMASREPISKKSKNDEPANVMRLRPGESDLRQKAIEFLFVHRYDSPPPDTWIELGILPEIMMILGIPRVALGVMKKNMEVII